MRKNMRVRVTWKDVLQSPPGADGEDHPIAVSVRRNLTDMHGNCAYSAEVEGNRLVVGKLQTNAGRGWKYALSRRAKLFSDYWLATGLLRRNPPLVFDLRLL